MKKYKESTQDSANAIKLSKLPVILKTAHGHTTSDSGRAYKFRCLTNIAPARPGCTSANMTASCGSNYIAFL